MRVRMECSVGAAGAFGISLVYNGPVRKQHLYTVHRVVRPGLDTLNIAISTSIVSGTVRLISLLAVTSKIICGNDGNFNPTFCLVE